MGKALEIMLSKNPKIMKFYKFLRRNVMLENVWQISLAATQCQGARLGNPYVSQDFKSLGHSYDILGAGMLWKPKDLHKIR
jgi:hypothetical protein